MAAALGTGGHIETLIETQTFVDQTEDILNIDTRSIGYLGVTVGLNLGKAMLYEVAVAAAPAAIKAAVAGARPWLDKIEKATLNAIHLAASSTHSTVDRLGNAASSNAFSTNLEPLFAKMLEQVHQQISELESEMCRMAAEAFKGLPALLDEAGLALLDSLEKRSAFGHSRSQGMNPTSESPAAPGSDAASGAAGPDAATVHLGGADLARQARIRAQLQPGAGGDAQGAEHPR